MTRPGSRTSIRRLPFSSEMTTCSPSAFANPPAAPANPRRKNPSRAKRPPRARAAGRRAGDGGRSKWRMTDSARLATSGSPLSVARLSAGIAAGPNCFSFSTAASRTLKSEAPSMSIRPAISSRCPLGAFGGDDDASGAVAPSPGTRAVDAGFSSESVSSGADRGAAAHVHPAPSTTSSACHNLMMGSSAPQASRVSRPGQFRPISVT